MNTARSGPRDEIAEAIAAFITTSRPALGADLTAAAKLVLLDSFAVALGALNHPAAAAAQRYARLFPMPDGCRIWGTAIRAAPEVAAVVNGVPLRAYDFNDLYMGAGSGGHPSDMVPGVIAVAEWIGASGSDVVKALAIGYELALILLESIETEQRGWDYVNLTGLAATAAIATLMKLSPAETSEALGITVVPHAASNEIESGDLNASGDLTMWKRFNGSDATRHAVYACTLASVGVEAAVQPFTGKCGFLDLIDGRPSTRQLLLERLNERGPLRGIGTVTFKRWPVGSRAQGAIQAALDARAQLAAEESVEKVRVITQKAVYEHLVARRQDPWHPHSRETADHSLPYIVGAALLDGMINPASFHPDRVRARARQRFLQRITVETSDDLDCAPTGQFLSRIELETSEGRVLLGRALPPPGHPAQPFSEADVIAKLQENVANVVAESTIERLVAAVRRIESVNVICELTSCLEIPLDD